MAVSMRQAANSCLGLSDPISMSRGIFGYKYGPPNKSYSLLEQLEHMKGPAFNLSVIFVGHRPGFTGTTSQADATRITHAIQRAREIYGQVNFGIRKIYWTHIPEDDVGSYTIISNGSEAEDLTEDWSANNDGIDVFFVQDFLNAGGWSAVGGSCDKDDKGFTGAVIELSGSDEFTGILLAHEVGHYLGLGSGSVISNVMGVDSNNDNIDELNATSLNLTNGQGNTMKNHCSVKGGC